MRDAMNARKRILVVAGSGVGAAEIRATLGDRFGADPDVRVVAPASGLSRLDWLTNAEDDARADAAERADEVATAIPAEGVEAETGDSDPVRAIGDALSTFPADQIVVVLKPGDEATWLETGTAEGARQRFSVPVTQLVATG
jgi:hypothetical protein